MKNIVEFIKEEKLGRYDFVDKSNYKSKNEELANELNSKKTGDLFTINDTVFKCKIENNQQFWYRKGTNATKSLAKYTSEQLADWDSLIASGKKEMYPIPANFEINRHNICPWYFYDAKNDEIFNMKDNKYAEHPEKLGSTGLSYPSFVAKNYNKSTSKEDTCYYEGTPKDYVILDRVSKQTGKIKEDCDYIERFKEPSLKYSFYKKWESDPYSTATYDDYFGIPKFH